MRTPSRRRSAGRKRTGAAAGRGEGLTHRPEADNLIGIFAALNDETKEAVLERFGGGQFSAFKTALADLAIEKLAQIRTEMLRLAGDPAFIDSVLAQGAEKARAIPGRTWTRPRTSSASCANGNGDKNVNSTCPFARNRDTDRTAPNPAFLGPIERRRR